MYVRTRRFYSAGQDGGGSVAPLGGSGEPLGGSRDTTPVSGEEAPKTENAEEVEGDRFARENQRKTREINDLKSQLEDLSKRLEETENAKLTELERLSKERERLQKQAEKAERDAKEAFRLLHSTKAVTKYELPEILSDLLTGETEEDIEDLAKSVSSALDKWAKAKFRPTAPDLDGGNRNTNGHKTLDKEQEEAMRSSVRSKW